MDFLPTPSSGVIAAVVSPFLTMSYSCNDNQNYFVSQGRTTSKVSNPPGGKTSISLGYEEPPKVPKQEPKAPSIEKAPEPDQKLEKEVAKIGEQTPVEDTGVSTTTTAAVTKGGGNAAEDAKKPEPKMPPPVSANAFASGSNMNGAQVMTGRPTSRVKAPPGGHTSIQLW